MKIAISQPTYLPWLGYFDLIDQVDAFVLLDNVQFEKQSWQQRNRIKSPIGLQWLTVPVMFRGRFGQLIKDVEIRDEEFWRTHLRAIELNYRRSRFFHQYFEELSSRLKYTPGTRLTDLNGRLLEWFMSVMGIQTRLVRSSQLQQPGRRTELLANICSSLGADQYVSPLGSAVYLLEEGNVLVDKGVEVVFQHYEHPRYWQLFPPFQPYASIVDLVFNEGERSLEILRSGRRTPFSAEQVIEQIQAKPRAS
ncbi:MAG TPA: WbqC family protein [Terriglobales bacterium]|nr:WbqC family protein [Terriglobales bacterium]